MPIKIPNGLPAAQTLAGENIFVMDETRAVTQDIRPLQILVLNLMPTKIETETQLSRLLGNTPLQVELEFLHTSSHESKNTAKEHLFKFYQVFDQVKDRNFDGMVVTDWGAMNDRIEGFRAGCDLNMPGGSDYMEKDVLQAVRNGTLPESCIDDSARRVLKLVFRAAEALHENTICDYDAHHTLAKRAAAEGAVLLKNEDNLLPLAAGTKVAVIGDFAETPRYQGAGSSAVNSIKVDSLLGCWAESGLEQVRFAAGFDRQGKPDAAKQAEAVMLAQKADIVLLCMGLDEIKESEGLDRSDMCVASNQIELLRALQKVNPNIVVVLSAGASVETPWANHCKALVYGCLGGQAGAGALVEVLTGAQNPCGKLAETWARSYADTPAKAHFGGDGPTVEYREGLYVGYRYYNTAGVPTAFPFGYGLSYTSFAYSDLKADETGVTLTVTNTGSCAGAEVVQLYVAKPDAKVFRPAKELKGFTKVQLEAGESKTVTIPLDDKAFRYWNVKTDRWEVEGGSYQLLVGASSADIRLTAAVTVAGTGAPDPYAGKKLEHYRTAQVQNVPDAEFEALLGRPIPENKVHIDRNMTLGEMGHGRSPIGWLAAAVLGTLLRRSIKKGKPDLNILFQYNMPLRALAKMTNGAISMGMVDGIVMELQGFWIIGLVRVIVEAVKNLVLNSRMEERLKNS